MGDRYEQFLRLPGSSLSYGRWVELGCPTDRAVLQAEAEHQRARVVESLARLPPIQDDLGRHLDERPAGAVGVERRCAGCEAVLSTELYGGAWVLPQHGHPLRERICEGSRTEGAAP
jgi:hypothetical protein